MQWRWDSSRLLRAKVLLVWDLKSSNLKLQKWMFNWISSHSLRSSHTEQFLLPLHYSMAEFQWFDFSCKNSSWPSVLEVWGLCLSEIFVNGALRLLIFLKLIEPKYKCLMNGTFCGKNLAWISENIPLILLSVLKLCLKEGRKLKSACRCITVSLRKKCSTGASLFFSFPSLRFSTILYFAIVLMTLCCLNVPAQDFYHIWIVNSLFAPSFLPFY